MGSDSFRSYTVQQLVDMGMLERPIDGNHGAIHPKTTDYVKKGIPFIMANDLADGKVNYSSCHFISKEQASSLKKGVSRPDDVLLTHKATIGRTAIVGKEFPLIILTPQVTYYRVKRGINNRYLKYYFDSKYFQSLFKSWTGSGSTRAYLGITEQLKLHIILPDIAEQNSIAATLSCLDDKIELNNRIIANLEAQAQAIFKSWFVDFEPFQDGEFEDSELGMIPKGWRDGTLEELIDIKYGKDHKKLEDGNIPVYGSGGIMRHVDKALYNGESVLIPRKGTLNNVLYVNGSIWTVDTMFYSIMKRPNIAKFVYLTVRILDLASMNSGSAVPSMTVNILNAIKVIIPTDGMFANFETTVSPMFKSMDHLEKENMKLTQIRDTLLPKLMSGEIEVPVEELK